MFLCTNIPFIFSSYYLLQVKSDFLFFPVIAVIVDIAGISSIWYHYNQLLYGPNRKEVLTPLLVDTITAIPAIISIFIALVLVAIEGLAVEPFFQLAAISGSFSIIALLISWKYDSGTRYILYHGLWHILSALTVFLIGKIPLAQ